MDAKALAMLGVLTAVNAALRSLGAGLAGVELVFFLLVLAGRVFGPGFGFVLGCTSLFASALLTAGVGPWLPFQMLVLRLDRPGRRAAAATASTGRAGRSRCCRLRHPLRLRVRAADEPVVLAVRARHRGARPRGPVLRRRARRSARTCTASRSTRCSPRPAAGTPAGRSPTRSPSSSSARPCWRPCAGRRAGRRTAHASPRQDGPVRLPFEIPPTFRAFADAG